MLSVLKAPFEVGLGENPRCKFDAFHRGFVSVKKAMIESGVIVWCEVVLSSTSTRSQPVWWPVLSLCGVEAAGCWRGSGVMQQSG